MLPIAATLRLAPDYEMPSLSLSAGHEFRSSFSFYDSISPSNASQPMAIRGSERIADVPPPLPPPKFIPGATVDPSYRDNCSESVMSHGGSFELPSFGRRDPFYKHDIDEGYQSLEASRSPLDFPLVNKQPLDMQHYDRSMLAKLDSRRNRCLPGQYSTSASIFPGRSHHIHFPQTSLPMRFGSFGFGPAPIMSTGPPRMLSHSHAAPFADQRWPVSGDCSDLERCPFGRGRRINSDGSVPDDVTLSSQDSESESATEEANGIRRLRLEHAWREGQRGRDLHVTAGVKRRARSPPIEDPPLPRDLVWRRDGCSARGSPTPRLSVGPSVSLPPLPSRRSGGYSTMARSKATPFGRRPPHVISSAVPLPIDYLGSSYTAPGSLAPFPQSDTGRIQSQQHQRAMSVQIGRPSTKSPAAAAGIAIRDPFMCQCCPKKPKKFETKEELIAHTAEKQYECAYCGSRFKNKNEMERHQNSLHLRPHSWSCAALAQYESAFHDSITRPGEEDTCGYCGKEFPRTGCFTAHNGRFTTEMDWTGRIRHLQDVHKFRECNTSKKFFRADHFRQHLKHSHGGTSGKWTNQLENACMIDEEVSAH